MSLASRLPLALFLLLLVPRPGLALDKQGSAHGGEVSGGGKGFNLSGSFFFGAAPYNPTYAARPDNTGLALFRYGAHCELSFWHDRISLGADTSLFSDRTVEGAAMLRPSELDFTVEIIGHLRSLELHVAYERDMPLDQKGPD